MSTAPFDFAAFVDAQRRGQWGRDDAVRYAFRGDLTMRRRFDRVAPLHAAASSFVRAGQEMMKNQLLGQMVKVGPQQFPSIHAIAERCAEALTVPVPTVYIQNDPRPNAYTFGTDDEAFIVVTSALIDHFEEPELAFVIGHETGHIQNEHVVYGTALQVLTQSAGAFLGLFIQPAVVALQTWYRRAEITCDRAGLLCSQDLDGACRSFMKLATGSQKLYGEMNLDAFLEQLEEGNRGIGQISEAFSSHPYLPKRVRALQLFADSALYRQATGAGAGGLTMDEVDDRTGRLLEVVSRGGAGRETRA